MVRLVWKFLTLFHHQIHRNVSTAEKPKAVISSSSTAHGAQELHKGGGEGTFTYNNFDVKGPIQYGLCSECMKSHIKRTRLKLLMLVIPWIITAVLIFVSTWYVEFFYAYLVLYGVIFDYLHENVEKMKGNTDVEFSSFRLALFYAFSVLCSISSYSYIYL